ncbi:L-threonylcarbamoyladenylate synthase [Estrella lausannensis]|uniref:Threonylcarbamoyl-AMP synthase n=1 Tax=Estrella lausannensis TaxID=483423 RepID=A0A0H5E2H6_9BACT|nr:L-threonylcarbamoyladenylate synthase [Estrella lausannensis]CRX37390.1 Sua5/YciO/YrdC/YwlC family protein [Estrella lausannensis]
MRVSVDEAAQILLKGENVAVPTETVYGLAALMDNIQGVDRIFALKNRPRANPLIIHIADVETVEAVAKEIPEGFYALASAFWPGPLALALPVDVSKVPESVRAGLPTACFRMPNHPLALELIRKSGPLVMPSANLSGKPSPTAAGAVEEDFGSLVPVLDGGPCQRGVESTILIWQDGMWRLGRLGALAVEEIAALLGYYPEGSDGKEKPLCPGQKWRHYAPKAHLLTSLPVSEEVEAVIGFDERSYPQRKYFFSLGSIHSPEKAAFRLYEILRKLDRQGIKSAFIDVDFPSTGLWRTLRERILKAAGQEFDAK